jgi:cytochrome P450
MKETVVDGTPLAAGSRVILLFGSGNRDDRHYDDPDRFDARRNPVDHLSFGYGTHSCGGQALAKLEAHAIVNALARRVRRFEIGEPVRHLNNVVRGLESVPVTSIETISG